MATASGALHRATPALGLVQSPIPLQAHSKPSFPAHLLLSAHEGNTPALEHLLAASVFHQHRCNGINSTGSGQGEGSDNPNWQTQGNSCHSLPLTSWIWPCFGYHGTSDKRFGYHGRTTSETDSFLE